MVTMNGVWNTYWPNRRSANIQVDTRMSDKGVLALFVHSPDGECVRYAVIEKESF